MATVTFSVRTDDLTKSSFSEFCKSAGLSISTAVNLFMKAVVKQNKIPFEITGDEIPTKEFAAAIKEAEEIENNPSSKGFDSVEALFKDLDA